MDGSEQVHETLQEHSVKFEKHSRALERKIQEHSKLLATSGDLAAAISDCLWLQTTYWPAVS